MTALDESGGSSDEALEKGIQREPRSEGSGQNLHEGHETKAGTGTALEDAPRSLHGWKWAVAYISMLSTTFLFSLDNTIAADIQPSILNAFGKVDLLPWIGTGFALGTMAVLPWGKVYGVFNIKWVYVFNILLFEVGSALCGASPNMTALMIGRVIAGVGSSGMYSGTLTYVSVTTSMKERPAYLSGSTVVWGIGSVLGPVVGGAFATSSATWRWIYGYTILVGAGAGCYIVAGFAIVQSLVPAEDIANAVGAMVISQDLGMVTFLAASGTLFQNVALQKVATVLPNASTADISNLVAGTSSTAYKSLSAADKAVVIPQITHAMGNIWLFFLVASALSFVLSLTLGRTRLAVATGAAVGG